MRIKKNSYDEFDVFCHGCEKTIIVEGPEDLSKEEKNEQEMFCLTCPVCGREIWFDGIFGFTLSPAYRAQVKNKKDYMANALEACKKLNEDLEGNFDKL